MNDEIVLGNDGILLLSTTRRQSDEEERVKSDSPKLMSWDKKKRADHDNT